MENWVKKSETTTDEFLQYVLGGVSLLDAKKLLESGHRFSAIMILNGMGLELSYHDRFDIVCRKNKSKDDYGNIIEVDTVYAEII